MLVDFVIYLSTCLMNMILVFNCPHHRLTMAKMNKLLGVTMEEKGISKLLSVDLEKAVEIKEAS